MLLVVLAVRLRTITLHCREDDAAIVTSYLLISISLLSFVILFISSRFPDLFRRHFLQIKFIIKVSDLGFADCSCLFREILQLKPRILAIFWWLV